MKILLGTLIDWSQQLGTAAKVNISFLFTFLSKLLSIFRDVYDAFHESERRQKLITEEMKVAGDFIPSKTVHSLNTISKAKMP